jgi:hypothetical protein
MSRRDPDADLDFDELARRAADGDRVALADLVRGLQHGTVVKVLDGRSDQPPQTDADICELGRFGGNYLILDIGRRLLRPRAERDVRGRGRGSRRAGLGDRPHRQLR